MLSGPADDFRGLQMDSNLNTPAVVISMSSIDGKEGRRTFICKKISIFHTKVFLVINTY